MRRRIIINYVIKNLEDIADISKGYHLPPSNIQNSKQANTLKILSLSDLKKMNEGKVFSYRCVPFEPKYNKDLQYIHKHDIVLSAITSYDSGFQVLYINVEPKEELCYNGTVLLIKAKRNLIDSRYLYIQLKSKQIQNRLLELAKGNKIVSISKKDLLKLEIPIYDENIMKDMCQKYEKIQKKQIKTRKEFELANKEELEFLEQLNK